MLAGTSTDKVPLDNTAYRLEDLENLMLSKDPNSLLAEALEVSHPWPHPAHQSSAHAAYS
jgi:hypothetical protein